MRLTWMFTLLALAACAPQQAEGPVAVGADDACGAAALGTLVGKPKADIPMSALPKSHRIVCADCVVTMEYSAERLTIQLDQDGRVDSVRCG